MGLEEVFAHAKALEEDARRTPDGKKLSDVAMGDIIRARLAEIEEVAVAEIEGEEEDD